MTILVVEDDLTLSAGVCFELDCSGYLTVAAYNCKKAAWFIQNEHFDLGAEDYVTKPFNMKILMRRVEVALRRNTAAQQPLSNCWSDGFLTLDFSKLTAVRGNEKISVTSNEYKLLKALIENAGNILTRQTLLERLWDIEGNFVDDHALTATINRLRTKKEKLYANGSSIHIEFSYYFCF